VNASPKFFGASAPVAYGGKDAKSPLAFRWYDKDRVVRGRRLEDHLRFAVCYWHSFCWPGGDPFGGETFLRPWHHGTDAMALARAKADIAFELFRLLDVPFFTFHDVDAAPEGASLAESVANLNGIADVFEQKMASSKVRLLWGTANLFTHRRYMAGAATNPDPDIFTYAAGQVRAALEVTHRLGGQNYVLWGGREGYETLLNTDLKRELAQLGRFLTLVVEHKHKIGFNGTILVEPKPKEPSKHQYDFDVATVYGMLQAFGLEREVKVNIEQNHAILAGHSFEHEIALAAALGIFGSLDLNRGDDRLGWDTDQFAVYGPELVLACYHLLKAGGFTTGGMNLDAKLRRQSIEPDDLLVAHIGTIDACARALLAAERMIADGRLDAFVAERYAAWENADGKAILDGKRSLDDLAELVLRRELDPEPKSGRQEYLERLVEEYV